jgi:hypothetical protein
LWQRNNKIKESIKKVISRKAENAVTQKNTTFSGDLQGDF